MTIIDLFWSFRRPYSYLAVPGAIRLEEDFTVKVCFRPVLPLAVREPEFFSPDNPKRAKYIRVDAPRRAQMLGMPLVWPKPDPIVQDMQTYKIAAEQPFIYRLTYLGAHAQRCGRGLAFAREISTLIFGGTRAWDQGELLEQAVKRAGLNLAEMDAAISKHDSTHANTVEENQQALAATGHWGVPTFAFVNEPFFGEDRIDTLRWRLSQKGLARAVTDRIDT